MITVSLVHVQRIWKSNRYGTTGETAKAGATPKVNPLCYNRSSLTRDGAHVWINAPHAENIPSWKCVRYIWAPQRYSWAVPPHRCPQALTWAHSWAVISHEANFIMKRWQLVQFAESSPGGGGEQTEGLCGHRTDVSVSAVGPRAGGHHPAWGQGLCVPLTCDRIQVQNSKYGFYCMQVTSAPT